MSVSFFPCSIKIESVVTEFKSSNEEYLRIKQAAEEKVKDILNEGKIILRFATASVIESLRRNPELCNLVLYDNPNNTTTISCATNYPSLISSGREQQQQSFNNSYTALILEEAEKLYSDLTIKLTNGFMTAAAESVRAPSLPSLGINNNKRKLTYKIGNTYQT